VGGWTLQNTFLLLQGREERKQNKEGKKSILLLRQRSDFDAIGQREGEGERVWRVVSLSWGGRGGRGASEGKTGELLRVSGVLQFGFKEERSDTLDGLLGGA